MIPNFICLPFIIKKKKMKPLRYKIKSVSSQHSSFPLTNLLIKKHWQSQRFCDYPQIITLAFYEPVKIQSIRIQAHPTKVPSRINILTYLPGHGEEEEFKREGFVSFGDNSESGFMAREVKQIKMEANCLQVRFMLNKNHQNINNFFNQVGLFQLSFMGKHINYVIPSRNPFNRSTIFHSIEFIHSKITLLNQFKDQFIKNSQFQQAKQIKQVLDVVKQIKIKLSQLQEQKAQAIKSEDYLKAKTIKLKIDSIKQRATYITNNFYDPNKKVLRSIKSDKILRQKIEELDLSRNHSMSIDPSDFGDPTQSRISQGIKQQTVSQHESEGQDEFDNEFQKVQQSRISYDEQIIPALMSRLKGNNPLTNLQNNSELNDNQFYESIEKNNSTLPAEPEQLTPSNEANSSILLQFYDNLFIRKLHSKYWQFKQQALTQILEDLKISQASRIPKSKYRCFIFIYLLGLKTTNYQISITTLQILANLTSLTIDGDPKIESYNEMEKAIIQTYSKLNDSNHKIRSTVEKSLIRIIDGKVFGCHLCYHAITKNYLDRKVNTKVRKIKLENLQYMVQKYGISEKQVPLSIADFALKAAGDQDAQVRKSAVNLIKAIKNKGGKDKLIGLMGPERGLKASVFKEMQK